MAPEDAASVVAFVVGALVFGAFAPKKTAGFAAPGGRRLLESFAGAERGGRTRGRKDP
jgi:hypothetical protein